MATAPESDTAIAALGQALEWALYWIATTGTVPVPGDGDDPTEYARWAQSRRALKRYGPESGPGVAALTAISDGDVSATRRTL